jgi:hypothetical protein
MDEAETSALKAVWNAYLDDLRAAADQLFRATTPSDPLTAAEGLRHLTRLTRMGLESNIEFADPDFPVLSRIVDETRKFGCDNPDTIYMRAVINGARDYRIVGRRGTVDYLSFLATRPDENGRLEQTGFVDSKSLTLAPDGSFEIAVGPTPPASGAWLKTDAQTQSIGVRQTFLDRRAETPAELRIERLGQAAAPAPITLAQMQAKLKAASGFALYCAQTFTDWTESYLAHPNQLPPADQEKCLKAGGDPNIYFYRSFWNLAPDEALIVHIARIPACDTWNLQVDNYWQESMDYRYFRSHLNKHTAVYDPDGGATIVIAHQDPGRPNWLSTANHGIGHFAMRWIRAAEHVDPTTRLCKFHEIDDVVAALERP